MILEVEPGSVAEMAGLHMKDVINSLDGKPVKSAPEFEADLTNRAPGATIRLRCMIPTGLGYFTKETILMTQKK